MIPFRFNWPRAHYYGYRTPFDVILKPRQLGFTTLVCGLFFADTILRPNTTSVTLRAQHPHMESHAPRTNWRERILFSHQQQG